ncbi:MAG: DUF3891 family protein [Acidobacteriota bacterium]
MGSLGDHLLLTTQTDHAALASEILALWRLDGLPRSPRREALVLAAREHDNGWREADSAPRRRGDGRPHDFMSIPPDLRREIWHRGVRRHVESRPLAALYILEHALNLHRRRAGSPEWQPVLDDWRDLRGELLKGAGIDPATLAAEYRLLDAVDTLSLAVCAGWSRPGEHAGVRYRARLDAGGAELQLDPFPLAGATSFTLACRLIEDRSYSGDVELAVELASARWLRLPVRIAALEAGRSGPAQDRGNSGIR